MIHYRLDVRSALHNSNYTGEQDTIKKQNAMESRTREGKTRFIINRSVWLSDEGRDRKEERKRGGEATSIHTEVH